MAGINADEVRVAANGRIFVAPLTAVDPTDVTAAWPSGWIDLGYANEDGVALSRGVEREDIPVWQSVSPVRRVLTAVELTAVFTMMQWNQDTVAFWFGGGTWTQPDPVGDPDLWRFDIDSTPEPDLRKLGVEWTEAAITYRLVVPRGEATETEEITLTRTTNAPLPLTFGALAPETGEILAYLLSNDPALTP